MTLDDNNTRRIIEYLGGRLTPEEVESLERDISQSASTRDDFDGYKWLAERILSHRDAIEAGHVSVRLLYELNVTPESLDDETGARVKEHLRGCETCRRDEAMIRELAALPLGQADRLPARGEAGDAQPRYADETTSGGGWLSRLGGVLRRPVPALVVVAAIIAIVIIGIRGPGQDGVDVTPRWHLDDIVTQTVVDVPVSLIVRGTPEDSGMPVPELSETAVLTMDLSFVDGFDRYSVEMIDFADEVVWTGAVPETFLDEGRLAIAIDVRGLSAGEHRIELIASEADGFQSVIAEARFRVMK